MPADQLTLAQVHAMLELGLTHTDNPAIQRLSEGERTVEGAARAYFPSHLATSDPRLSYWTVHMLLRWRGTEILDLTDPGTVQALAPLLALALGMDPGVMGLECSWAPSNGGWILAVGRRSRLFTASAFAVDLDTERCIFAPTVANEPDPVRALTLACLHVLEVP